MMNKTEKRLAAGFALTILLLSFLFVFWPAQGEFRKVRHVSQSQVAVGEVNAGTAVVQEISTVPGMRGISLCLATYKRQNEGNVFIRVEGRETGTVYFESTRKAAEIRDNAFVDMFFSPLANPSADSALVIRVTADGAPGKSITLWASEEDIYDGTLTVGGEKRDGDLTCEILMESPLSAFLKRAGTFLPLTAAVGGCWYFFGKKWKNRRGRLPDRSPVHQAEGSFAHQADGLPMQERAVAGRLTSFEILFLALCACLYFSMAVGIGLHLEFCPDEQCRLYVTDYIFRNGSLPLGWEEEIRIPPYGFSYGISFSLPYTLSALCMKLVSFFTASAPALTVAARFPSVLSMTGVVYYAIRAAKRTEPGPLRWMIIVPMALTPQLVFLGSYFNLDAFALFSVMMILDAWMRGTETDWDFRSCAELTGGMSLCLLGYEMSWGFLPASALLCVLLMISRKGKRARRQLAIKAMWMLLAVLLLCGWKFVRNAILYQGDFLGTGIRERYRAMYAWPELKVENRAVRFRDGLSLFGTLTHTDWLEYTWNSMISGLGGMNVWAERWVYRGYLLMLPLAAAGTVLLLRSPETRRITACALFAGALTVFFSLYYTWNTDYQPQGRYVIYVFPLLIVQGFIGLRKGLDMLREKGVLSGRTWEGAAAGLAGAEIIFVLGCLAEGMCHCASVLYPMGGQ